MVILHANNTRTHTHTDTHANAHNKHINNSTAYQRIACQTIITKFSIVVNINRQTHPNTHTHRHTHLRTIKASIMFTHKQQEEVADGAGKGMVDGVRRGEGRGRSAIKNVELVIYAEI